MSGIGKFLYPPIVPTYQTPFVYTQFCRVYFSMPSYNNLDDFSKYVQVSISTQKDNRSALDRDLFKEGILFTYYCIDESVKGDNKYYIDIYNTSLKDERFVPETYYKVQIRLIEKNIIFNEDEKEDYKNGNFTVKNATNWINNNLDKFTEWSTITLVKSIYKPTFTLNPFSPDDNGRKVIFSTSFQTLSGILSFQANNQTNASLASTEYLKSYRIYIIKKEENGDGTICEDSGELYPINKNEILYNIKRKLENGNDYSLTIELYTNNGFIIKKSDYNFTIFKTIEPEIDTNVFVKPDYINGRVRVKIIANEFSFVNNFVIIRASSKDDFSIWEDVHYCSFYNENIKEYIWHDYTVESGVLYKYAIQRIDTRNNLRSREKIAFNEDDDASVVMLPLEDIFLSRADMQFKIKFDPNISSFKTNYLETKIETLGSKYPFIRRNGKVKYREFPIGGLITAFCDEEGLFLNKTKLYSEEENSYYNDISLGYNINHGITEYKDFVYEKLFRDRIVEFLQEDSVKLFRSQTEGNILIKLTNINLTPNQSLGRMLYSFSATAVEVADCTIENYDKYGVQLLRKDNLKNETVRYTRKIGQLIGTSTSNFWEKDIVRYLSEMFDKTFSKGDTWVTISNLEWIRITFNSKPFLINKNINKEGDNSLIVKDVDIANKNNIYLGYAAKINGNVVLINSNGFYELKSDNVNVSSLLIPEGVEFTLDYIAKVELQEINYNEPSFKRRVLVESVGQIHDKFKINELFVDKIRHKYILKHRFYSQDFALLNDITIEADCGTVLNIIQKDSEALSYEIGKTNVLKFKDEYEEGIFKNFSFEGVHLYEKIKSSLIIDKETGKVVEEENEQTEKIDNIYLKLAAKKGNKVKVIHYTEYDNEKNDYPYIIEIKERYGNIYISEDNYLDLSNVHIDDLNYIKTKLNNCLFTINNKSKIYHKNEWYDFNKEKEIVKCPIDALVDYTYSLIREEYK